MLLHRRMSSFIPASGNIQPGEIAVILNENPTAFSKHPTHPAQSDTGLWRIHKTTQHQFRMKINNKLLIALYFPAKFCRLQLQRLYFRLKVRYLFIYRCQFFSIKLLHLLNRLHQKWLLYRLLAMETTLKQLLTLFDYAEARQSSLLLFIARMLWILIHLLCKLQGLSPKKINWRKLRLPWLYVKLAWLRLDLGYFRLKRRYEGRLAGLDEMLFQNEGSPFLKSLTVVRGGGLQFVVKLLRYSYIELCHAKPIKLLNYQLVNGKFVKQPDKHTIIIP